MTTYEDEISDSILIKEIPIILKEIVEDKHEGEFIDLKHAVDLSTYLGIGEDLDNEGDFIQDCPLDKWIDGVKALIKNNQVSEVKQLIISCLERLEKYEVIVKLKKLNVL
jgi:hypothetical protein